MNRPTRHRVPMIRGRRPRRGFTLIELLIVIGIILLLIAAGALSYRTISTGGRERETRSTLARLVTIATEYEAMTGRIINHIPPPSDNPYRLRNLADFNWNAHPGGYQFNALGFTGSSSPNALAANTQEEFRTRSIERFVWATHQVPALREMYGALDDEVFGDQDDNGFLEVRDAWGNRIVYVAYVAHQGNPDSNPPGDDFPLDNFLPRRDRPYFASAGPSGDFGNVNGTQAERQAAEDNIYSFELD